MSEETLLETTHRRAGEERGADRPRAYKPPRPGAGEVQADINRKVGCKTKGHNPCLHYHRWKVHSTHWLNKD